MEKFSTFFALKLGLLVFGVTEGLSTFLQGNDLTIGEAMKQSTTAIQFLGQFRNDSEHFRRFFCRVEEESRNLTDAPTLPRQRRPPKRIDEGQAPHSLNIPV
jgi:hypothetical protein